MSDTSSNAAHFRLATLAHGLRFDDLPNEVVECTKKLMLDSLGCLLGGVYSPPASACRDVAAQLGGAPQATVIGTSFRASASLAALCNGTALRFLDFNDAYSVRDAAHPSGNLPALIAVAEIRRASGKALLRALVAAYEIHLRLCEFAGAPNLAERGWHNTTNLQIAAAAGASLLLTEDPVITAQAIAIAATHGNTLAQIQRGKIGTIKATADGWVAKAAVEAAMLAHTGITGPADIFEGEAGWAQSVAGKIDYEGLLAPLNGMFRIVRSRVKAYAAVGPAMAPVQAAIELHRAGYCDPANLKGIVVRLPSQVVSSPSMDERKRFPTNRETADHSYHYCVVIALIEGACGPEQFAEEKLHSMDVHRLLSVVMIEPDAELTELRAGGVSGGAVEITLLDGSRYEARVPYPPGHAHNPLTQVQIEKKFIGLAVPVFGEVRSRHIRAAIDNLDDSPDISDLMNLLGANSI